MTDDVRCLVTIQHAEMRLARRRQQRLWTGGAGQHGSARSGNKLSVMSETDCRQWKLACRELKEFGLKACRLVSFQLTWLFLGPNLPIKVGFFAQHLWPFWLTVKLQPVRWRTGLEMFKGDLWERWGVCVWKRGRRKVCVLTLTYRKTKWQISKNSHTTDGSLFKTKWFIRGCT